MNRVFGLALLAAALSGCGGGGDGDAPAPISVSLAPRIEAASPASDVSAGNYRSFAPPLARLVLLATGNDWLGGALGSGGGASPLWASVARRLAGDGGRKAALASGTDSGPCPVSGSLSVTVNDANDNSQLDEGDSFSVSFADCVVETGAPAVDGSFSMNVRRSEMGPFEMPAALEIDGRMSSLSVGNLARLDGGFHITMTGCDDAGACDRMRLSFDDLAAHTATETVTLRIDTVILAHEEGEDSEISGGIVLDGQTYAIVPQRRFSTVTSGSWPTSGRVRLQDGFGDALQLTAKAGGLVDFGYLPRGAATPTATWLHQGWSNFE